MTRPRTSAALLAGLASLLIAACGGGGSSGPADPAPSQAPAPSPSPAPSPAPDPAPAPAPVYLRLAPEQEPYWSKGAGVRPNLAHLLPGGSSTGNVVSLSAAETSWLSMRAAAAGAEAAAAGAAKAAASVRLQAPAVQRRTVTGLYTFLFHTAAGTTQQPLDLTLTNIAAIAPDGSGGFEVIAATAKRSDGTYAIAGVPEGPHWVRLGNRFVWTDQGFVDWCFDTFGRPDATFPTLATRLVLNAGNLAPWQTSDSLAWVVPQQGYSFALPLADPAIANAPRLGETALGAFGFELGPAGLFVSLLDAAKGDIAYLNQLATLPAVQSAGPVRVLARSMVLPPLTTADGTTTTVNSAFLDIAANAKLRLRFQRSAFGRHADAVFPGAVATANLVGVSAFALSPLFGTPADAYSLLEFNTLGGNDAEFGLLRYGNPFPAEWNRVIDGFVGFTRNYLAPGASVSEPLLRGLSVSQLLEAATRDDASVTLAPAVTPPRHPQINGKTLFANQLAVGTSPRLSWTAPDIGVPDRYFVRILELLAAGPRSQLRSTASFTTRETSMTVPPGVLQPGHVYVLTIAATRTDAPLAQPNRNSLPLAFATLMTAIVSP